MTKLFNKIALYGVDAIDPQERKIQLLSNRILIVAIIYWFLYIAGAVTTVLTQNAPLIVLSPTVSFLTAIFVFLARRRLGFLWGNFVLIATSALGWFLMAIISGQRIQMHLFFILGIQFSFLMFSRVHLKFSITLSLGNALLFLATLYYFDNFQPLHLRSQKFLIILGYVYSVSFLIISSIGGYFSSNENYRLEKHLKDETARSDKLLLNILPLEVANELKKFGTSKPKFYENVTVIFTDFVGFTGISEKLTPGELVAELDKCFSYFDSVAKKYGLEKLKTIGDSYMAAGGIPDANNTSVIDSILAALEIQAFMNQMKDIKTSQGLEYWEVRLGIHNGPIVAGVVGDMKFAYDIWGDTVNLASRMESSGEPGKINISSTTYELAKYLFKCEHRGKILAKRKGEIDMYFVIGIKPKYSVNGEGKVPNERFKKAYVQLRRGRKFKYPHELPTVRYVG